MNAHPQNFWRKSKLGWRGLIFRFARLTGVLFVGSLCTVVVGFCAGVVENKETMAVLALFSLPLSIGIALVIMVGVALARWLVRWLCCWRHIRWVLIGLACLLTLIALAYTVENWRGKRAWTKFKREMEARGEHFDLAAIVPKPVPDEQNFAMAPLLKPLLDYKQDPATKSAVWRDEAGLLRAQAVDAQIAMPQSFSERYGMPPAEQGLEMRYSMPQHKQPPGLGRWPLGERTDLRAWQEFYQGNTNYPAPAHPGKPAADVLVALSKFDAEITELRAAAERPCSVFPVHYEEGYEMVLRHVGILGSIEQVLSLRAVALLEEHRSDEALHDVELAIHLGESLRDEPMLLSQLDRMRILQGTLQPVWEGLADGRWNESQLAALQSRFEKLRLFNGYPLSVRGENVIYLGQTMDRSRAGRYTLNQLISNWIDPTEKLDWVEKYLGGGLSRAIPDGWFYQNQLVCSRAAFEYSLPMVDLQRGCINFGAAKAGEDALTRLNETRSPYTFIARLLLPFYVSGAPARRFAHTHTSVDSATLACALERYRLAHGQYPQALDALSPQFITKLPHDVINGQPLKYRRVEDGGFILYSVGWNQADDGGETSRNKEGRLNDREGDWVWRYPAK